MKLLGLPCLARTAPAALLVIKKASTGSSIMAEPVCPPSPHPANATLPIPHRRLNLRLIKTRNQINTVLARANSELSAFRIRSALALFTEVLTLAPGHPCAFLNRSLCYLTLDYPNLAAIDAYRAVLGAHWAMHENKTKQTKHILTFGRFTQSNTQNTKSYDWAVEPGRFVALGLFAWLKEDLASIAIEPKDRAKATDVKSTNTAIRALRFSLVNCANDIILKGFYRLALALWKCGGGALRSALDVLADAQDQSFCTSRDAKQYQDLENTILLEIENIFKDEVEVQGFQDEMQRQNPAIRGTPGPPDQQRPDSTPAVCDTSRSPFDRCKRMDFEGLARTRFTNIRRELYPWDTFSLRDDNPEALGAIDEMVKEQFGQDFSAGVIEEGSKPPKTLIYSHEDLAGSKLVFEEMSCFHVTSGKNGIACDSCGTNLKISSQLVFRANRIAKNLHDAESGRSGRSDRSPAPSEDSQRTRSFEISIAASDACGPSTPESTVKSPGTGEVSSGESGMATPSESPTILAATVQGRTTDPPRCPEGFQLCPDCRSVAFCSAECCESARKLYHTSCCKTGLEQYIRVQVLPYTWPCVPEPHIQVLLNLLFLRVVAHAALVGTNPLSEPWMRCLDGNLDSARDLDRDWIDADKKIKYSWNEFRTVKLDDIYPERDSWQKLAGSPEKTAKPAQNLIPWSFENNVKGPLHYLFFIGGTDLALDTRFDGWVLETMRAKIEAAMRVTPYPRFQRKFDDKGDVEAESIVKRDRGPNKLADGDSDDDEADVWVASLHPIATLVRVAGDGEKPNVHLLERNGTISCRTLSHRKAGQKKHKKEDGTGACKEDADTSINASNDSLADSLMDMDLDVNSSTIFDVDSPPTIRAGEPLLRAPVDVEPLIKASDKEADAWRTSKKNRASSDVDSVVPSSESSILFGAGDTMLDADETEWGDEFEMDEEDVEMEESREEGEIKDEDEDEGWKIDPAEYMDLM